MLEVRNIAFSYGSRPVLRNVSFTAAPGETVAVVGANGAGKTTLVNILSTLTAPDAGKVVFSGRNALDHSLDYRRQLGCLPERIALYEEMTVRDYLSYRAALKGEMRRRIRRRVGEAVDVCRLGEISSLAISRLSAGQKKRVALADALLLRPRLMLLDDLFAGLDGSMRAGMREILRATSSFSCAVVTGHEIEDLSRMADRFVVLNGGTVSSVIEAEGAEPAKIRALVDAALGEAVK